jgi:hypothetical protein
MPETAALPHLLPPAKMAEALIWMTENGYQEGAQGVWDTFSHYEKAVVAAAWRQSKEKADAARP